MFKRYFLQIEIQSGIVADSLGFRMNSSFTTSATGANLVEAYDDVAEASADVIDQTVAEDSTVATEKKADLDSDSEDKVRCRVWTAWKGSSDIWRDERKLGIWTV